MSEKVQTKHHSSGKTSVKNSSVPPVNIGSEVLEELKIT